MASLACPADAGPVLERPWLRRWVVSLLRIRLGGVPEELPRWDRELAAVLHEPRHIQVVSVLTDQQALKVSDGHDSLLVRCTDAVAATAMLELPTLPGEAAKPLKQKDLLWHILRLDDMKLIVTHSTKPTSSLTVVARKWESYGRSGITDARMRPVALADDVTTLLVQLNAARQACIRPYQRIPTNTLMQKYSTNSLPSPFPENFQDQQNASVETPAELYAFENCLYDELEDEAPLTIIDDTLAPTADHQSHLADGAGLPPATSNLEPLRQGSLNQKIPTDPLENSDNINTSGPTTSGPTTDHPKRTLPQNGKGTKPEQTLTDLLLSSPDISHHSITPPLSSEIPRSSVGFDCADQDKKKETPSGERTGALQTTEPRQTSLPPDETPAVNVDPENETIANTPLTQQTVQLASAKKRMRIRKKSRRLSSDAADDSSSLADQETPLPFYTQPFIETDILVGDKDSVAGKHSSDGGQRRCSPSNPTCALRDPDLGEALVAGDLEDDSKHSIDSPTFTNATSVVREIVPASHPILPQVQPCADSNIGTTIQNGEGSSPTGSSVVDAAVLPVEQTQNELKALVHFEPDSSSHASEASQTSSQSSCKLKRTKRSRVRSDLPVKSTQTHDEPLNLRTGSEPLLRQETVSQIPASKGKFESNVPFAIKPMKSASQSAVASTPVSVQRTTSRQRLEAQRRRVVSEKPTVTIHPPIAKVPQLPPSLLIDDAPKSARPEPNAAKRPFSLRNDKNISRSRVPTEPDANLRATAPVVVTHSDSDERNREISCDVRQKLQRSRSVTPKDVSKRSPPNQQHSPDASVRPHQHPRSRSGLETNVENTKRQVSQEIPSPQITTHDSDPVLDSTLPGILTVPVLSPRPRRSLTPSDGSPNEERRIPRIPKFVATNQQCFEELADRSAPERQGAPSVPRARRRTKQSRLSRSLTPSNAAEKPLSSLRKGTGLPSLCRVVDRPGLVNEIGTNLEATSPQDCNGLKDTAAGSAQAHHEVPDSLNIFRAGPSRGAATKRRPGQRRVKEADRLVIKTRPQFRGTSPNASTKGLEDCNGGDILMISSSDCPRSCRVVSLSSPNLHLHASSKPSKNERDPGHCSLAKAPDTSAGSLHKRFKNSDPNTDSRRKSDGPPLPPPPGRPARLRQALAEDTAQLEPGLDMTVEVTPGQIAGRSMRRTSSNLHISDESSTDSSENISDSSGKVTRTEVARTRQRRRMRLHPRGVDASNPEPSEGHRRKFARKEHVVRTTPSASKDCRNTAATNTGTRPSPEGHSPSKGRSVMKRTRSEANIANFMDATRNQNPEVSAGSPESSPFKRHRVASRGLTTSRALGPKLPRSYARTASVNVSALPVRVSAPKSLLQKTVGKKTRDVIGRQEPAKRILPEHKLDAYPPRITNPAMGDQDAIPNSEAIDISKLLNQETQPEASDLEISREGSVKIESETSATTVSESATSLENQNIQAASLQRSNVKCGIRARRSTFNRDADSIFNGWQRRRKKACKGKEETKQNLASFQRDRDQCHVQ